MNLEPLRAALRAETEAGVHGRLAEADAECARVIADAESEARGRVAKARREGEDAAAKEALRRRATATRRARETRLQAQRRQIGELERRALEAALRLREHSRYPSLLARLADAAREQLGHDCELEYDPDGQGGLVGRTARMSVDYTLPTLVNRVVASLNDELEDLWR
jgi:vacuolar-type H+-ATPase subunit E/Vma4